MYTLPNTCNLRHYQWIYLSNFYASDGTPPKLATHLLRAELGKARQPFILCCEPILGNDPRAITAKNSAMTATERYENLCRYYSIQFGLKDSIPTCTTLKTEMTGHGRRWEDMERMLLFGVYNKIDKHMPMH
jgi:hypothetical protein